MTHKEYQSVEIHQVNLIELLGGSPKKGGLKMKASFDMLLKTDGEKMAVFRLSMRLTKRKEKGVGRKF